MIPFLLNFTSVFHSIPGLFHTVLRYKYILATKAEKRNVWWQTMLSLAKSCLYILALQVFDLIVIILITIYTLESNTQVSNTDLLTWTTLHYRWFRLFDGDSEVKWIICTKKKKKRTVLLYKVNLPHTCYNNQKWEVLYFFL